MAGGLSGKTPHPLAVRHGGDRRAVQLQKPSVPAVEGTEKGAVEDPTDRGLDWHPSGQWLRVYEGDWLDPDAYLEAHPNWKDCASLPIAPAERETMERDRKKQEDPLAKTGIVGTFCRAYSIPEVIDKYLSDVYAPTDKDDRYDYIPGEGSSGVVVYEDRFVYSHHATDPAGGKLLNAFDLVRAHLFDDDDPKKSFNEMAEFAARDERVQALGLEERTARAGEDFAEPDDEDADDWKKKLVRQKKSTQLENSLFNIKLIMPPSRSPGSPQRPPASPRCTRSDPQ